MDKDLAKLRSSYDLVSQEYADRIYAELEHKPLDRKLLDRFAALMQGALGVCLAREERALRDTIPPRWDQHTTIPKLPDRLRAQPVAGPATLSSRGCRLCSLRATMNDGHRP